MQSKIENESDDGARNDFTRILRAKIMEQLGGPGDATALCIALVGVAAYLIAGFATLPLHQ